MADKKKAAEATLNFARKDSTRLQRLRATEDWSILARHLAINSSNVVALLNRAFDAIRLSQDLRQQRLDVV